MFILDLYHKHSSVLKKSFSCTLFLYLLSLHRQADISKQEGQLWQSLGKSTHLYSLYLMFHVSQTNTVSSFQSRSGPAGTLAVHRTPHPRCTAVLRAECLKALRGGHVSFSFSSGPNITFKEKSLTTCTVLNFHPPWAEDFLSLAGHCIQDEGLVMLGWVSKRCALGSEKQLHKEKFCEHRTNESWFSTDLHPLISLPLLQ